MKTVQLAIRDSEYAQSLRNLLLRDGTHRVILVDKPDLKLEGVVVIDGSGFENLAPLDSAPERFVVITRKGTDHLARVWDAGVRHVVFLEDSPNTAQLAIIAAELRLPKLNPVAGSTAIAPSVKRRATPHRDLLALDPSARYSRCCFPALPGSKSWRS